MPMSVVYEVLPMLGLLIQYYIPHKLVSRLIRAEGAFWHFVDHKNDTWFDETQNDLLKVCFISYFMFNIAVLPHRPGVLYYLPSILQIRY